MSLIYYNSFVPFLKKSFMEREINEEVRVDKVYCPMDLSNVVADTPPKVFVPSVIHIDPIGIKVFDETPERIKYILSNFAGESILCGVKYLDYEVVAIKISYDDLMNEAKMMINGFYDVAEGVSTFEFIDAAKNNTKVEFPPTDLGIVYTPKISLQDLYESADPNAFLEYLNENLPPDVEQRMGEVEADMGRADYDRGQAKNVEDSVYQKLYGYLSSPDFDQSQVPLLLGPTAVFKSASVKSICKQLDMRMVDFRVAFTGRLDYTGLIKTSKNPIDGIEYSEACPMLELTTVSTGFLTYVEKSYAKAKKILDDGFQTISVASDGETESLVEEVELTEDQRASLESFLVYLSEYVRPDGVARVPVLFFDEITRLKDPSVEGVLTNILNQKEFNDLDFHRCKFIAASNSSLTDVEAFQFIYDAKDEVDPAYGRRFIPIKVFPEDVMDRWFDWASGDRKQITYDDHGREIDSKSTGSTNIHRVVTSYLQENKDQVYNQDEQLEVYDRTGDVGEARLVAFPNYRTWTMISDYLYKADKESTPGFVRETVLGLLGPGAGSLFCEYLKVQGYKEVTEIINNRTGNPLDPMSRFLQECAKSGTPGLLVGPSSLGKTARIKDFCKRNGDNYELITIVLSALSREDLMGFPVAEELSDFLSKGNNFEDVNLGSFKNDIEKIGKDLNDPDSDIFDKSSRVSKKMTTKVPSADIKQKFLRAYREGKTVVLFFDECNRNTNPAIMSSMFEAISDSRLFGQQFDPSRVIIFGAMNYKEGVYDGAKQIDAALAARFSIFRKDDYDESDVDSFIQYLKDTACPNNEKNAHSLLIGFLENKIASGGPQGKSILVDWFRQVEAPLITDGVPATRSFTSLSKELVNMSDSSSFCGKVLFGSVSIKAKIEGLIQDPMTNDDPSNFQAQFDYLKSFMEDLREDLPRWNALKRVEEIILKPSGKVISSEALLKDFNLIYDSSFKGKSWDGSLEASWVKYRGWIKSIIYNMEECDKRVRMNREATFGYYIGDVVGTEFSEYFNANFGGLDFSITIPMLTDKSLIKDFFNQKLAAASNTEQTIGTIVGLSREFEEVHGANVSADHYTEFLLRGMESLSVADNVRALFVRYGREGLDSFVYKAEKEDPDIILRFFSAMGMNHVAKNKVEETIDVIKESIAGDSGVDRSRESAFI